MLLRNSTPHLGKLTERWQGPFLINSFGGDHGASYTLKTLDGKSAPNTHHGDHLRIFCPREGYLRPTDEEPLKLTRNLRFRRRKDWSARDLVFLFIAVVPPPFCFLTCCQHYYRMRCKCIRHILLVSAGGSGLIRGGVVEEEKKNQIRITPS